MGLPKDERERMIAYLNTVDNLLNNNKQIDQKDIESITRTALERTKEYLFDVHNFYKGFPREVADEGIKLIEEIEKIPKETEIKQLKLLLQVLDSYDTLLPVLNSRAYSKI